MRSANLNISYSIKRDADVWQDLKDGSRKALDDIYYSHIASLMAYGKQLTPDSALVDDCIQELFVDLWVKRERLGNISSIKFYLIKSLKRRVFRALKKEHKKMCFSDLGEIFSDSRMMNTLEVPVVDEDMDSDPDNALMDLVDRLSPIQKEIIFLKFFNNLTFDEIAEILDLTKKQLYNAVSKAMLKLRNSLISVYLIFAFLF